LRRAFPSPEDGRDHPIRRSDGRRTTGDVEVVLIDSDPAGAYTFNEHHADCLWCHRNTKYDLHRFSKSPNWFAALAEKQLRCHRIASVMIAALAELHRVRAPPSPGPPP
jgi:hypothetical protein